MSEVAIGSALNFFCRHLVALTVLIEGQDGKRTADAYTCFVLEVRGLWFLATAGHVVRKLEAIAASTSFRVVEWGLFDGWSPKPGGHTQVPFNFVDSQRFAVDDEEQGIDVGLMGVPPFVRRTLEANGITALNDKTWRNAPDDMDVYFLLGLPSELIENVRSGNSLEHLKVEPVLIPFKACEPPPSMVKPTLRFYGKIANQMLDRDGVVLSDIDGMSGGPIIGIRTANDQSRYFLVAIQSAWRSDLRVIAGSYAIALAGALEQELDATLQDEQS